MSRAATAAVETPRAARLAARLGPDALAAAALVGGLAFAMLRPVKDPDLWWHLAAGGRMLDGLGVPWTDPYSSVAHGRPWIAYSWLPEIVFAGIERAAGLGGVIVVGALLVAVLVALVLRTCRAAGARPTVALAATALAAGTAAPCLSVRPHLVSFLCMAVFVDVLARDRRGEPARLWWLVPAMCLWANAHILFPFGGVLLALEVVTRPTAWRTRARLALLAVVAGATLVTPYGWHLHAHVLVMMRQPLAFPLVTEFQTPLGHPYGLLPMALLFATTAAAVWSPRPRSVAELAGVFAFGALALTMTRNLPFFAIVAAPVLAAALEAILPPSRPAPTPRPAAAAAHAALLAAAVVALAVHARTLFAPDAAVDAAVIPRDAARWLRAHGPDGRLLNDFDAGGWLIYTLADRYPVSIDGRTQVYGEELLAEYTRLVTLAPGWRTFFDRVDPDVVLWHRGHALASVLELLPDWRRVYADDLAVVYVRNR